MGTQMLTQATPWPADIQLVRRKTGVELSLISALWLSLTLLWSCLNAVNPKPLSTAAELMRVTVKLAQEVRL